jgi:N-acetylgalactosamine kinase
MPGRDPLYSIILAGGRGRRMRSRERHKVCFEIAGTPAIVRAIDVYNRLGVAQNIVVVGDLAGQVVETVGRRFANVAFAYQPDARGTGDAARCGLQALAAADDRALILLVAGDKIIAGSTLGRLLDHFDRTAADLVILVSPAASTGHDAGRILFRANGSPLAIVEMSDLRVRACRAALLQWLTAADGQVFGPGEVEEVMRRHLPSGDPWSAVFGPNQEGARGASGGQAGPPRAALLGLLRELPHNFRFGSDGQAIAADEALRSRFCNESVYLVRKGALCYGLNRMTTDNAQGEEYLTDAIGAILQADGDTVRFTASWLPTEQPDEVMAFNNPEELLLIEDRLQGQRERALTQLSERLGPERFRTADQWLELFRNGDDMLPATEEALRAFYGDEPGLLRERQRAYRQTLLRFRDAFGGDRRLILVRSPGRVNIMGRHIDWQGGHCNLMAVDREAIMAVGPRQDDTIELRNIQPELFPDASISLSQLVSQLNWDDWLSCVNSQELQRRLRQAAGNWRIYIEAAVLRLQMEYRQQMLSGMEMVVNSNIPVAAGMSSSSALVVAAGEAVAALNGLDLVPRQFVNFCGEGEWFVGTRGGSADHAAMKFGSKGMVIHVKFHDFELLERMSFPRSHRLVVCNSFVQAKKAAGAKAAFNARVASYLLGVALVRREFPQFAPFVRFVRDIDPEKLCVPPAKIYEVLLRLPETITVAEARRTFAGDAAEWGELAPHLTSPTAPAEYPVRGVMLFGISECQRAKEAVGCLRREDMARFGRMMTMSHDGERRFRARDNLTAEPFSTDVSDAYLQGLMTDLGSGDAARQEQAALANQPGGYRCSTPEIDAIVDIACRTPGVLGAQIAGAGLGGCAMVLAEAGATAALEERLVRLFYQPKGLPSGVHVCTPAAGSRVVSVEA